MKKINRVSDEVKWGGFRFIVELTPNSLPEKLISMTISCESVTGKKEIIQSLPFAEIAVRKTNNEWAENCTIYNAGHVSSLESISYIL